jgi:hypothetical protein
MMPPNSACGICGCKPNEVHTALLVARKNIELAAELDSLRTQLDEANSKYLFCRKAAEGNASDRDIAEAKLAEVTKERDLLRASLIRTPDELHRVSDSVTKMGFGPEPHTLDGINAKYTSQGIALAASEAHRLKLVEALQYYAAGGKPKHDLEPGEWSEFGCGCCAGIMGKDECIDPDSDVIGRTAREALASQPATLEGA